MYWFAFYNIDTYYAEDPMDFLAGITIYKGNKDDILDFAWQGGLSDTNCTDYHKSKRTLILEIIWDLRHTWTDEKLKEIPYSRILMRDLETVDLRKWDRGG